MQIRTLGGTSFMVGRIALGCVTFGREIGEGEAFELMDYAVEQGINLFDTAEAYGEGASERIVGRWLRARGCRSRIVLQTKVTTDFSRAHVREALARSLDRLQCEQVDVYLMHSYDGRRPIEESLAAMTESVDSGQACTIGCSNFTAEQLRTAVEAGAARQLAPLRVLQPVYNLVAREAEDRLFALCAEHGIGITSYSPLGAGFLTGKYSGDRTAMPAGSRFAIKPAHADLYFHPANFAALDQLRRLSETTGHSLATLAMAWVLRQPAVDSVLTGARDKSHLDNALHCLRHLAELAAVWEDAAHRFA